ncbi:AAA family ATPase [Ktedonosporobacter rubrisoli]|uniref:AAA family ATPase n=1 Tax=Ktedonosporobacter rubrisoli TaxID=2509675 RepID=A0A4P6JX70_KTERU|nr:AAA family ATPase [Ktedonosporobacter rubrisoli]QBD79960.1 AAA family ATPase [Ktedonosporobacter rubrisoli]
MPKNATKTKREASDLDKSIDLGIDQFGRFLKLSWGWIVISVLILLFFISGKTVIGLNPGTLLTGIFEIGFAICYILIQFIALFWFLGRPRLYWVMPGETGVTFNDYKGNPEVLEAARRVVAVLGGVKEFHEMGGKPVRGLLLTGHPGTGKSYLAQCMSTEAGVPFAYASAASFRAMFIGMDVLMISRLYRKARRLAREYGGCIVFMDEIDAIGASRTAGGGSNMAMGGGIFGGMGGSGGLNQLLMEMDPPNIETGWFKKVLRSLGLYQGRAQSEPVLTVGATNVPESLDPALLRPGRFDRKINVAPPTDKYRPEVIEYYLNKVKRSPKISIAAISARLVNYTPVEIKHVVNEAVIIAHFDGRDEVTYKDLVEAQDVHEYGLRQLSELSPIERRRLAYHEAGHAVACYYLMDRYFPSFVTLHMHGDLEGAAAFAAWRQKETIITQSKEDVLARIQVALASRASEELFLDVNLNGVTGDFASATQTAAAFIGAYGMDGTLTSYLAFAGPLGANPLSIPELAERTEALLQKQFKAVKQLFQEHSEAVIAVAEALIEREELVAEEIKQLIEEADARGVVKTVFTEFEPLLSNGHNGHLLSSGNGKRNGTGALSGPRIDAAPQNKEAQGLQPRAEQGYSFLEQPDNPYA